MFRLFEVVTLIGLQQAKSPEQIALVAKLEKKITDGENFMLNNGFDKIVIEDFCDLVKDNFNKCKNGNMSIVEL